MTREKELAVDFAFKLTKREAVSKSTMLAVFKAVWPDFRKAKQASTTYFLTDSVGRSLCFGISKVIGADYRVMLDCELTTDETASGNDIYTYIDYCIEQGKPDYASADYHAYTIC